MIVILTVQDDLHAQVICSRIRQMGHRDCHIVTCDTIAYHHLLSLRVTDERADGWIHVEGIPTMSVDEIDVIWLRRLRAKQLLDNRSFDSEAAELIDNDSRAGLAGLLATAFHGRWISSPEATARGSDKLLQLAVARNCGFRVPDTLVTQEKHRVVEFHELHSGKVVVKTLAGGSSSFLLTRYLDKPDEIEESAFSVCPALYQEYIPGTDHIRLNCFGSRSFAALIETDELDWRPNLKVPIRSWPVSDSLHLQVRTVLDSLGLEMGIVDLKRTPEGDFVWLEVNPQGQFLFLDALTDLHLAERFSEFLVEIDPGR